MKGQGVYIRGVGYHPFGRFPDTSRFDEPPSQQTASSELRISVAVTRFLRFAGDLERLDIGTLNQSPGLFVKFLVVGDRDFAPTSGELGFEVAEQTQPPLEPRDLGGHGHILRELPRVRHEERVIIDPQKS